MDNHLIHETSPYLQQHAHNPVDWYPWGPEALGRARKEDRPIFLSIGYSACHWCHVMEHECFENPEIAGLMNGLFINIKVDREERPDLDSIYMSAVQMITGSGGWPMSVFLTPDLKPFFGGTYFPPDDRYGRPGFPKILRSVAEAYRTRRDEVEESAGQITERIRSLSSINRPDSLLSPNLLDNAAAKLGSSFDRDQGGFGGAPKFPHSLALQFLMRDYRRTGRIESLKMVRLTLDKMAAGGIYDQVGGGFHRYATDARWLVPHFEKMLYDNALLAVAYIEAFQLTANPDYASVARETLDSMLRDMASPEGGFYSTLDADSDGREGVFYTWTLEELQQVLGNEAADLFARAYDVDEQGVFEGRAILHRIKGDHELASIVGLSEDRVGQSLADSRVKLHEARGKRVRPHRDEKILADWNGLAISAMARGSRALGEPRFSLAAEKAARFILRRMMDKDGSLLHVWKDGEAKIPAFLDDVASLLVATTDLYEATGDPAWLTEASSLQGVLIRDFWDDAGGGFFDTSSRHQDLIARTRRVDDGAVPAGNSLAAYGMIRLARITGEGFGLDRADRSIRAFSHAMEIMPSGTAQMLIALDLFLAVPQEVAVIGPPGEESTRALRCVVDRRFLPHTVLLMNDGKGGTRLAGLDGRTMVQGRSAAYVCSNFACKAPVTTPDALESLLRR